MKNTADADEVRVGVGAANASPWLAGKESRQKAWVFLSRHT
jgi:hypothetical protein